MLFLMHPLSELIQSFHHLSRKQHSWSFHFILQNVQNAGFGRFLINVFPLAQKFCACVCERENFFRFLFKSVYTFTSIFPKLHDSPAETKLRTLDVHRAMSFHLSRTKTFWESLRLFVAFGNKSRGTSFTS